MHTKAEALKKKISGVKNKAIDKTSDALSFPKRAFYNRKEKVANQETNVIKATREFDKHRVPNFDHKGSPTTAGEHRVARDFIAMKHKNK